MLKNKLIENQKVESFVDIYRGQKLLTTKYLIMKKPQIANDQNSADHQMADSRRRFLKTGGMLLAGSSILMYACEPDALMEDNIDVADARGSKNTVNLGTGDVGILNYAYVLEQLEAAFYTHVMDGAYFAGAVASERKILEDLYNHEVIHRDFFKTALDSMNIPNGRKIPELQFDFSAVDFSSRDAVLQTSIVLEDTGVSAYNGAGDLIENTDYLLIAGKIVSVEARHAAAVRSIYLDDATAFAGDDVVDQNGLDLASDPRDVISTVNSTGFIVEKIVASALPKK